MENSTELVFKDCSRCGSTFEGILKMKEWIPQTDEVILRQPVGTTEPELFCQSCYARDIMKENVLANCLRYKMQGKEFIFICGKNNEKTYIAVEIHTSFGKEFSVLNGTTTLADKFFDKRFNYTGTQTTIKKETYKCSSCSHKVNSLNDLWDHIKLRKD